MLHWDAQQMLYLDRPRPLLPVEGEQTSLVYLHLGVGAIVSPWNFPLALTTGMMSAAVVAGNTVIVKPASASATPQRGSSTSSANAGVVTFFPCVLFSEIV